MLLCLWAFSLLTGTNSGVWASGQGSLPGPIEARVIRVHDGDTLVVRARIWVDQDIGIKVRISGIDAPEMRSRCAYERDLAGQARDFMRRLTEAGSVRLYQIRYGKYAGRVLANVKTMTGVDLAQAMLIKGFARPYHGGRRKPWCPSSP